MVGPRVGSGQTFCQQSWVGSGQRFAESGPRKVTRGQLWVTRTGMATSTASETTTGTDMAMNTGTTTDTDTDMVTNTETHIDKETGPNPNLTHEERTRGQWHVQIYAWSRPQPRTLDMIGTTTETDKI